jgi:hypothetical protein
MPRLDAQKAHTIILSAEDIELNRPVLKPSDGGLLAPSENPCFHSGLLAATFSKVEGKL